MVAGIRFRKARKATGAKPVELAGVNNDTANGVSVSTNKLGCRMHHDIRSVGDWIDNRWTCGCVVNDQWETVLVGDFCNGSNINGVQLWVTNRFSINGLGVRLNRCFKRTWVKGINKCCRNAKLWKRMAEEVPCPAVQAGG